MVQGFERVSNSYCLILKALPSKHLATAMYGGVAQLGEHLPCTQGVKSSNLFISTKCGLIAQVVRAHA